MIKVCEYCNKEFETYKANDKYCGWKCKDRSIGVFSRKCVTCNKEFKTNYPNSKYCTEDCKPIFERICCRCGKVYTTKDVRQQNYCSEDCKDSIKPQLYKCLNNDGEVIFIGCNKNLSKAMGIQYKPEENTLFGEVDEIWVHDASGDIDKILKEIYLIRKYKPKYREYFKNKEEHKTIEDLEVNSWTLIYKNHK